MNIWITLWKFPFTRDSCPIPRKIFPTKSSHLCADYSIIPPLFPVSSSTRRFPIFTRRSNIDIAVMRLQLFTTGAMIEAPVFINLAPDFPFIWLTIAGLWQADMGSHKPADMFRSSGRLRRQLPSVDLQHHPAALLLGNDPFFIQDPVVVGQPDLCRLLLLLCRGDRFPFNHGHAPFYGHGFQFLLLLYFNEGWADVSPSVFPLLMICLLQSIALRRGKTGVAIWGKYGIL